ncbi:glycosyltransferase [Niallia circulans]|uniref:glycosyltransferase n=1 Tax=Niallia circulans TaxID=1397 RepID=UPI003D97F33C
MRVWMYPKKNLTNKYNELFSESLEANNIEVKNFIWKFSVNGFRNIFLMKKGDIFHFHWLHTLYNNSNLIIFFFKICYSYLFICLLKLKGVKIVWTMHNLYPHEYINKTIENRFRKWVVKNCNLIFALGDSYKHEIISNFEVPEEKIKIIKHGHYKDKYGKGKENLKKKYGIRKDECLFLFIGQIRPYKGIENLIDSFSHKSIQNSKLIIAGNPTNEMKGKLEKIDKENILKILKFIPDEEMVDLINSCDFVILPYQNVTMSGTAILALTYNKPIIISSSPLIREYLDESVAIFYDNENPENLYQAINQAEISKSKFKYENFEKLKGKLDWNNIAKKAIKSYKEIK